MILRMSLNLDLKVKKGQKWLFTQWSALILNLYTRLGNCPAGALWVLSVVFIVNWSVSLMNVLTFWCNPSKFNAKKKKRLCYICSPASSSSISSFYLLSKIVNVKKYICLQGYRFLYAFCCLHCVPVLKWYFSRGRNQPQTHCLSGGPRALNQHCYYPIFSRFFLCLFSL